MNDSIVAIAIQKDSGDDVVLQGSPNTVRELIQPALSRLGVKPETYSDRVIVGLPSGAATHFLQSVKLLANFQGVRLAIAV